MNVIGINSRKPHIVGPCKCFKCKHEWIGVMLVGTQELDCPECGCTAVRTGAIMTSGEQFMCNCQCFVFRIDRAGPYCVECGTYASGY